MGYDMSIENPDPVTLERKNELHGLIYGKAGLISELSDLKDAGEASPVDESIKFPYPWWAAHADTGGTMKWHDLVKTLNALMEEYEEIEAHSYYRLNIWGMGVCRQVMDERGMLAYNYDREPEFPDLGDFGLEEWPDREGDYGGDYSADPTPWPADSAEAKFCAEVDKALSWSPEERGLPIHKVGSNDGWLVTPQDCIGALEGLREWAIDRAKERDLNADDEAVIESLMLEPPIHNYDDGPGPVAWWPSWVTFLRTAAKHDGFRTY